jgi:membrane fusion protein (multidrug efflux system)
MIKPKNMYNFILRVTLLTLLWGGTPRAAEQRFDCVMDPASMVSVGGPVVGLLEDVLVNRGDKVARGQPLARMQSDVEAANVALDRVKAQNNAEVEARETHLQLSRKKLQRTQILYTKQVAAEEKLDELRADVEVNERALALARMAHEIARLELLRSEQLLRQREIRSPIDGFVTERRMHGGENLHQESVIVKLARLDPLYVEVYLPVRLYPLVQLGMTAGVEPATPIEGRLDARVTVIDKFFDVASGTFGVRLETPNADGRLPGGHRCQVVFPFAGS